MRNEGRLALRVHTVNSDQFVGARRVGRDRETIHTVVARVERDGQTGYGFGWTFNAHRVRAMAEMAREIGEHYFVADAAPEELWDRAFGRMGNLGRIGLSMQALALLDMAVWDARSRARGIPVREALGYPDVDLPALVGGLPLNVPAMTPDEILADVASLLARGVRAIKLSVDSIPVTDAVSLMRRVRSECGPEIDLMADFHGGQSREDAVTFAQGVADLGLTWLEDPVDQDDLVGFELVRKSAPGVPLGGGQYADGPGLIVDYAAAYPIDALLVSAARIGGVTAWRRTMAELGERHPSLTVCTNTLPQVHVSLLAGAPGPRYLEYMDWWTDLLGPVQLREGRAVPFEGPGWGVDPASAWPDLAEI